MLASSFSSVHLPEPLRPTMPKNSPWRISKEMPSSARSSRYSRPANGWTARSFSESTRWVGIRKALWRSSTRIAGGASGPGAGAAGVGMSLSLTDMAGSLASGEARCGSPNASAPTGRSGALMRVSGSPA